jgi:6-phosphogluconate dehydrogenase
MQLGMIGLGRMGGNMTIRLAERGHDVKTYDRSSETRTAKSLEELRDQLDVPRTFWLMIPAGAPTEETFKRLLELADAGDTIVDGGNSNFRDSQRRYRDAQPKSIHFVDAGVSGGIWGLRNGYCLMVGGDDEAVQRVEPIFKDLAPEDGYAHVGASGAGHFTKMVHNGIEYGLMQAYAEGFEVMKKSEFALDLHGIAGIWRYGSVVRSWLLELLHDALEKGGDELPRIKGYVEDSGEGRWTIHEAIA